MPCSGSGGVLFADGSCQAAYGTVAVFTDRYGNRWDLIEPVGPGGRGPI